MAQNFTADWYELTYVADTGFQNAESNDNVLRSNFSGANAPASPIVGQQWFDIDTGTMKIYEIDAQWLAMLVGDAGFLMYIASNDAQRGMLITDVLQDAVLALRGGNYGPSGGAIVGDWDISGLTVENGTPGPIRWKNFSGGDDYTYASDGSAILLDGVPTTTRRGIPEFISGGADGNCRDQDFYTDGASGAHDHPISHNANWRPLAAVGTLQYPDLS